MMADKLYKLVYLNELKNHQRATQQKLQEIQLRRLKRMINHAYDHVRFYRDLFDDNKIKPENIKKLDDLKKIPVITKKELQANEIISNNINIKECNMSSTSGSTGIPFKVWSDKKSTIYSSALSTYANLESGLRPRDKYVELSAIKTQTDVFARRYQFLTKDVISLYNHSEKIIDMLKYYKPDVIYSFPSVFKTILYYLKENEKKSINPRLIFTHGETLNESRRAEIRSGFGADVFNFYGSAEFNKLAFECDQHSGLHMITDCAVIEFIKNGEDVDAGQDGTIIVTGLYNYAMPLIRYEIGDIGIPSDAVCDCGRNWPLISRIEGRTDDFLILPSGRIISPRNINVIEDIPGIMEYRTIQERKDKFLVLVVPNKEYSPATDNEITNKIKKGCLEEEIDVEIKLVDKIPRERTGKLRTVISKVHQ